MSLSLLLFCHYSHAKQFRDIDFIEKRTDCRMGFNLRSLALEATRLLGGCGDHISFTWLANTSQTYLLNQPNVKAEKIMKEKRREGTSYLIEVHCSRISKCKYCKNMMKALTMKLSWFDKKDFVSNLPLTNFLIIAIVHCLTACLAQWRKNRWLFSLIPFHSNYDLGSIPGCRLKLNKLRN